MSKGKRKFLGLLFALVSLSSEAIGATVDDEGEVLRARAYLALADVYYQEAQAFAESLTDSLSSRGIAAPADSSVPGFSFSAEEAAIYSQYLSAQAMATEYYERVYSENDPSGAIWLPIDYSYLRREAFDKASLLSEGFLFGAHRRKGASLYAVNADFKKDIIQKTQQIADDLERLDVEARRIRKELGDFNVSRVGSTGELVGIEESRLNAKNYQLDVQTQSLQIQAQMQSLDIQLKQEANDLTAKLEIFPRAKDLLERNWMSLMNVKASPSSPDVITVPASSFARIDGLRGKTDVYIRATGRWVPKGVTAGITPLPAQQHRFLPVLGLLSAIGAVGNLLSGPPKLQEPPMPELPEMESSVLADIKAGKLDCDANGISMSNSESVSVTSGTSSSSGGTSFSFFGIFNASSGGESTSASKGRSKSVGTTLGLKSGNADMPSANIGALIAILDSPNLSPAQRGPFLIGSQNVLQIPDVEGDISLILMQNDASGKHGANTGDMSVELRTAKEFGAYLRPFLEWYDKDCDAVPSDPNAVSNCGFRALLTNGRLGFQKDPQTLARNALRIFERSYGEVIDPAFDRLLDDIVSASATLAVAGNDIKLAHDRYDMTAITALTARDSMEFSKSKVKNTQELVEAIERRSDAVEVKRSLLVAGTRFYEDELANVERLRAHAIARLKRYMGITVDSFNYLYLTDFKLLGEAQPGYEGQFYKQNLQTISDLVLSTDVDEDLLNPNRGYLIRTLTPAEFAELKTSNKTTITLKPEEFFCQGFGIEDQVRVHVEKVGFLLDIDPINEQRFFKNPNVRRMAIRTTHGSFNLHYDLDANPIEYYLPTQSKDIYGYSQRVLTDYHSDYAELGLSNLFHRTSFRNTSFASSWTLELKDLQNYDLSYLNGVKFIIYFTSTEARGGKTLKTCLNLPGTTVQPGSWTRASRQLPSGAL